MSVRRRRPLAEPAARAALELTRAESEIALLDRVRPLNWVAEQTRLTRDLGSGTTSAPAFEYGPRAQLGELRRRLGAMAGTLAQGDLESRLLAERALELELEASLVEHVATPEFAALATRRFPPPSASSGAGQMARELAGLAPEPASDGREPLHLSDDAHDPDSLWSQILRLLARVPAGVRVERVVGLVSLAAVAEGAVRVRAGARLSAAVARRIALHEVEGHVRPRVTGRQLGGVFLGGTAFASEDEEGRAILLEQRAGILTSTRRRELGWRFLAAESVRGHAEFWDTVELLQQTGASSGTSVELACRVHRGGGLGRELIYLAGYLRVASGLTARPELERFMSSGRASLRAAEMLLDGGVELDDDGDVI